jgi:hypothetical protein
VQPVGGFAGLGERQRLDDATHTHVDPREVGELDHRVTIDE